MIYPERQEQIEKICKKHNIRRLRVFGSMIEGEADSDSDIDILVEFQENQTPGLFVLGKIQQQLNELFPRPVDLKTSGFFTNKEAEEILNNSRIEYEAV